MKSFILGVAAVVGLALLGTGNKAEANHFCGGYGGYGGGYYQPSYGYGHYPQSYGHYSSFRPYNSYGHGYGGGYWGGGGVSVGTPGFGFRYRW